MGIFKRASSWRGASLFVLLFGFAVRAAIPLGFMPAVIDGRPVIIVCDGRMHGPAMADHRGAAGSHDSRHEGRRNMTACPFGAPAIGVPFAGIAAPAPQIVLRDAVEAVDPDAPVHALILDIHQRGPPQSF